MGSKHIYRRLANGGTAPVFTEQGAQKTIRFDFRILRCRHWYFIEMKTLFKQLILAITTPILLISITPALAVAGEMLSLPEAISKTIEVNAGIKIQAAAVDRQEGVVQAAQGEFDWYLYGTLSRERQNSALPENKQVILPGRTIDQTEETATVYGVGATKKFRSGIVVQPSLSSIDYENNTDRQDPISQSDVVLEFLIPLLQGAGAAYTRASERAAQKNLTATQALSTYNISSRIFNTAGAYWNCLAARRRSDILADTQRRTDEIFHLVEQLVSVGELEPAILSQASAERYSRRADLSEGERALEASRLQLSAAIGLPPETPDSLPLAEGDFPMAVDGQLFTDTAADYIRQCLALRGDYLAAKQNVETEKILLEKAQNETRPRLDFTLKTGYGGLDERLNNSRYYGSLYNHVPGLNAYAGIRVELPIHNNTAREMSGPGGQALKKPSCLLTISASAWHPKCGSHSQA